MFLISYQNQTNRSSKRPPIAGQSHVRLLQDVRGILVIQGRGFGLGFETDLEGSCPLAQQAMKEAGVHAVTTDCSQRQHTYARPHHTRDPCCTHGNVASLQRVGSQRDRPFACYPLLSELLNAETSACLKEAQALAEAYHRQYNHHRPHSFLGHQTPAVFTAACLAAVPASAGPLRLHQTGQEQWTTLDSQLVHKLGGQVKEAYTRMICRKHLAVEGLRQWAVLDLNQRPPACRAGALAN